MKTMTCGEAQPFLSALYDGEFIPPAAAEHSARCPRCQEQLKQYAEAGVALRAYASSLVSQPLPPRTWLTPTSPPPTLWEKARQSMRVPKFAFAALILALLGLSSRLAVVEVRAHSDGPVVLLKLTPAQGDSISCGLFAFEPDHNHCFGIAQINNANFLYSIKIVRKDGERVLLSLRSRVDPESRESVNPEIAKTLPEAQVWFTPGEPLLFPNTANITLTGQWSDHVPVAFAGNEFLDPNPNELRFVSPLLLKDNQVVSDQLNSAGSDQPGEGVSFYAPGQGSFILSAAQLPGAVPAKVQLNRVTFQSNGHAYQIVTGMPVSRQENLWLLHKPNYQPHTSAQSPSVGAGPVNKLP